MLHILNHLVPLLWIAGIVQLSAVVASFSVFSASCLRHSWPEVLLPGAS